MTAAAALAKVEPNRGIREEIKTLADDLQEIKKNAEKKLTRLANLVHTVQKKQLFREWVNSQTRKKFTSFEDWIKVDVKQSKSQVYRLLGVKESLNLPDATMEKIGPSRCYELVRVAKEKPKMLGKIVAAIEKNPDLPVYTVQQMAANAIAGHHFDSGDYVRWTFAIKAEDDLDIQRAFAVMQAMEAVANPDSDAGRGRHLVNLCNEFLTGKEARKVLARLEEAGAFSKNGNSNFIIEDD